MELVPQTHVGSVRPNPLFKVPLTSLPLNLVYQLKNLEIESTFSQPKWTQQKIPTFFLNRQNIDFINFTKTRIDAHSFTFKIKLFTMK